MKNCPKCFDLVDNLKDHLKWCQEGEKEMKETDELILEQLTILNDFMSILVSEHLKHFEEWRIKNGLH